MRRKLPFRLELSELSATVGMVCQNRHEYIFGQDAVKAKKRRSGTREHRSLCL